MNGSSARIHHHEAFCWLEYGSDACVHCMRPRWFLWSLMCALFLVMRREGTRSVAHFEAVSQQDLHQKWVGLKAVRGNQLHNSSASSLARRQVGLELCHPSDLFVAAEARSSPPGANNTVGLTAAASRQQQQQLADTRTCTHMHMFCTNALCLD